MKVELQNFAGSIQLERLHPNWTCYQ